MDYEEVLGRAWDIAWHHKGIWILGTLVALYGQQWSTRTV